MASNHKKKEKEPEMLYIKTQTIEAITTAALIVNLLILALLSYNFYLN